MPYALEGMKVVDFGIFFDGPYAAKLLGDLGASVIKVEALTGDPLRRTVGAFNGCQRNKRSIAIDMKSDEGRSIAHRLMSEADVVCHNMRPGVAERLGIDYETAKRLKPDIIALISTPPETHPCSRCRRFSFPQPVVCFWCRSTPEAHA